MLSQKSSSFLETSYDKDSADGKAVILKKSIMQHFNKRAILKKCNLSGQ